MLTYFIDYCLTVLKNQLNQHTMHKLENVLQLLKLFLKEQK